ncbi:MAG: acyl-CoA dehydratase activase [Spirochaetes bacterium]|nr:acyl-CoA dehydratase activase [Spirochaetota bacterium]
MDTQSQDMVKLFAGVDAGSTTLSIVIMDEHKNIRDIYYGYHHGKIKELVQQYFDAQKITKVHGIAITSSTPKIINAALLNTQVAYVQAAKEYIPHIRTLIIIGGEKFGVIEFDENGNYVQYRGNTSCAAGTGAFLDQQARRLQLAGSDHLSQLAIKNVGDMPKIASRCAVFAKTDLIHVQQEGYTVYEIADGLCYGLARNIADTLFSGTAPVEPVAVVGGVSLNKAVIRHLESILGTSIIVPELSHLYGSIGAALWAVSNADDGILLTFNDEQNKKEYHYKPLDLIISQYPDFCGIESYVYHSKHDVEVDIYSTFALHAECFIGIDIGSTSTKMAVTDSSGNILAGFYTRTAGKPFEAVQSLFEALDDYVKRNSVELTIKGAATTGSGRKFIGTLIGADVILDEISAHAKAAVALNPEVDTIIEIGGQDSKFTMIKNGNVVFSQMNNVCAAGTGSFIEEQAYKLGCTLTEYAGRALGKRSPLASDRCTVFMERDINYLMSKGYSTEELLATVLHSVVENYLSKVSGEAKIGNVVCFQGATAKNKALVAAFEQRLQKPIFVSKYCHLTGALGCALEVMETLKGKTKFRGIDLYKKDIPIRNEVCTLCTNHCKLKVATIDNDIVAFGFLCGRDYHYKRYVNKTKGIFDFTKERKKIVSLKTTQKTATVGVPAALHLVDELDLWIDFFNRLGIRVTTSVDYDDPVSAGKRLAQAEFCAPMAAFHGHITYLADKCEFIFAPFYLEKDAPWGARRQYCYYTQFAPSLGKIIHKGNAQLLSPILNYEIEPLQSRIALYKACKAIKPDVNYIDVMIAFEQAHTEHKEKKKKILEAGKQFMQSHKGIAVVLLGRPYNVLLQSMNKSIPSIFVNCGVPVLYQDMIDATDDVDEIQDLLKAFHWHYASKIIETAYVISKTQGMYPVLLTSFKCAPDSFVMEYFKRIMDKAGKPYLILQLDEHDSTVGYQTRIEAAIRSFTNHYASSRIQTTDVTVVPSVTRESLKGKTVLLPNWDIMAARLLKANLQREGIDAHILYEDDAMIAKGTRTNTGQCIPLNIIAYEYIDYVEKNNLNPAHTILWMANSEISCNIRMYPYFIKTIFDSYGKGFEHTKVFVGDISFREVSVKAAIYTYFAFMFSGLLRRVGCHYRPYEVNKGLVDQALEQTMQEFELAFKDEIEWSQALSNMVKRFQAIKVKRNFRPKVAIFGDLYVRDNDVMNQNLIKFIETHGGEVITTPYNYYAKMIANPYFKKWFREGKYGAIVTGKTLLTAVELMEKKYYSYFETLLNEPNPVYTVDFEKVLSQFGVTMHHTGESFDNLIKIFALLQHYPDIQLFVQTSPAFCCPSLITEAMAQRIYEVTGVPVVSITYDGTGSFKNDVVVPYLTLLKTKVEDHNVAKKLS